MDAWHLPLHELARWAPTVFPSAGPERPTGSVNPRPPMAETVEADLLQRVAGGDMDAFAQFYDRCSSVLYSLAMKILRDAHEAEEVLQEAMTQIWERAAAYDAKMGKPLSWALTITRNKAIDRIRSSQRKARLMQEIEWKESGSDPTVAAESSALQSEASALIRRALADLPFEQRRTIELAYFGGLTQSEIAAKLNQPLGTIKARIRRGMITLRDALEGTL
jgi:RNA polymerase sigma-70 factor (ECF subfamily)